MPVGAEERIKKKDFTMKALRLVPLALGFALTLAARSADVPGPTVPVNVVFDHPERFTDVKDANFPTDSGRDAILSRIRDFIVREATRTLPAGDDLTITFTDIDLAGDYEPWHGAQWDDVRVVKDIYPPAFKFTYSVTDSSGKVLKQGSENIRDLNFQTRLVLDTSDTLRYEKDILKDWVRGTLRGLK
jgi:hypothetical protein